MIFFIAVRSIGFSNLNYMNSVQLTINRIFIHLFFRILAINGYFYNHLQFVHIVLSTFLLL